MQRGYQGNPGKSNIQYLTLRFSVAFENRLPFITARGDVVNRTGIFNA